MSVLRGKLGRLPHGPWVGTAPPPAHRRRRGTETTPLGKHPQQLCPHRGPLVDVTRQSPCCFPGSPGGLTTLRPGHDQRGLVLARMVEAVPRAGLAWLVSPSFNKEALEVTPPPKVTQRVQGGAGPEFRILLTWKITLAPFPGESQLRWLAKGKGSTQRGNSGSLSPSSEPARPVPARCLRQRPSQR